MDASIINAVIPGTTRIYNYIATRKDLFLDKKVKDIADAYLLAASEIELGTQRQSFERQLSAKENVSLKMKNMMHLFHMPVRIKTSLLDL